MQIMQQRSECGLMINSEVYATDVRRWQ